MVPSSSVVDQSRDSQVGGPALFSSKMHISFLECFRQKLCCCRIRPKRLLFSSLLCASTFMGNKRYRIGKENLAWLYCLSAQPRPARRAAYGWFNGVPSRLWHHLLRSNFRWLVRAFKIVLYRNRTANRWGILYTRSLDPGAHHTNISRTRWVRPSSGCSISDRNISS